MTYLKYIIGALFVAGIVYAADNIKVPKNQGKAYLTDTSGNLWPAQVVYTTDGNSNPIPIAGGGGGGGSVTQGTVPWVVSNPGKTSVALVRNVYSSTNVTTTAYVQLIASTSSPITQMHIFDSSGQTLVLAVGAASSEVDQLLIVPGGNGIMNLAIPSGSRISVKARSANATVGELDITFLN